MNAAEQTLIREMKITAASHRLKGEPRTCELLERAALKLEKLLTKQFVLPSEANISDLARLLLATGWRDTCDAQWTELERAIPDISALVNSFALNGRDVQP